MMRLLPYALIFHFCYHLFHIFYTCLARLSAKKLFIEALSHYLHWFYKVILFLLCFFLIFDLLVPPTLFLFIKSLQIQLEFVGFLTFKALIFIIIFPLFSHLVALSQFNTSFLFHPYQKLYRQVIFLCFYAVALRNHNLSKAQLVNLTIC